MRARTASLMAVAATLSLVAAACGGGGGGGATPSATGSAGAQGTIRIGPDTANNHGSKDLSGESETDLEADNFYFSPTVLTGTPGQKLKIDVENEGSATHNFSLDAQSVDQDIAPGEKQEVEVTFPQSGTLEFYCKYHRTSGMVGELSVS